MTQRPTQALHRPRFNAAQREALDTVGIALKQKAIDFPTAAELGEMVKAGRVDEVLKRLEASLEGNMR